MHVYTERTSAYLQHRRDQTSPPQVHKATAFHCIRRIRHQRPQRRCIDGLLHLFHLESRLLLSRVCFVDVHPCSVPKISRRVRANSRGGDIDEHDIDDNVAFLSSANFLTCTEMSTGRPGNSITNFTVLPPGVEIHDLVGVLTSLMLVNTQIAALFLWIMKATPLLRNDVHLADNG